MSKATKITKKPSLTVKKLGAPKRSDKGHKMTAEWQVPSGLTNTSKNDRATELEVIWVVNITGKNDPKEVLEFKNEKATTSTINLDKFSIKTRRKTVTYTRDSFYPLNSDRKLYGVIVQVKPTNDKGKGKPARASRKFGKPRKPTLSPLSFNTETGIISTTVETNAGTDYYERYDTRYTMTVTNPFQNSGKAKNTSDSSSTKTSFTMSYDASDYQRLSYSQYIKVEAKAFARGYAGDSATVTRTEYISYPAQAVITDVLVEGRDSTSKCTIKIDPKSTKEHPVDKVRLQIAADVTYDSADDIPANEWEDTEIVDNKNCTALSIATSELIPSRGNHTFVRVVTYHLHEGVLYRYSKPYKVTKLEVKSAPSASIDVDIIDAHAGEDGKSATVLLGWNKDGLDDFTGTEISWATSEDTWKSTEEPNSHRFTWSDGQYPKTGTKQYNDSAEILVKGLNEGETYYIKARRYLEADNEQYSDYTASAIVTTNEKPESIGASCQRYIADGEPLPIYWTLAGNGIQTEWRIERLTNGVADGTVIAEGKGSVGASQISAERLKELSVDNSVSFRVGASTGSGFVWSETHTVSIIEKPTLSLTAPSTMTSQMEQPYTFVAQSNALCDLIVIITSQGVSGQFPEGVLMQASGDTVHSDIYRPAWENGSASITIPSGLNFWDNGEYTLSVVAVDRTTGLRTEPVTKSFVVNWTNQAVSPVQLSYAITSDTTVVEDEAYYELVDGEYILVTPEGGENPHTEGWCTQSQTSYVTLTVIDEVDADGDHTQAVQIDLTPPQGSSETDVYDIYRMDIENPTLIGQGFPLTYTAVDEYAPFGKDVELKYRIALRTIDGDVEFSDITYTADCENIRFDWSGGSLELPYGNSVGDSFSKDTQIRKHMNGVSNGYWNQGVERKSSLSSSIIKIVQPRDIERARLLARYAGPVFVRLPNGSAFEADVQVTDLSIKNEAVTAVAFDATEIGLTNEFSLPTPFTLEEGE